ncbi:hypothetical protein Bca101_053592 [Brassica carinata]
MGNKGNLILLWAMLVGVVAMAREHRLFERTKGISGLEKIIIRDGHGRSFELYGGQVTSWKNEKGEELIFMSRKYSNTGPLPSHGFARNRFWKVEAPPPPLPSSHHSSGALIDLILTSSQDDLKIWPHKFIYRLRVALGHRGDLTLTSRVGNTDVKPFNCTFALHPYFSISDIRLYLNSPNKIRIVDHKKKKTIVVHKEGQADADYDNAICSGVESMGVSDLGDEDYMRFVAVESAAVKKPIILKPGQEWKGVLQVSVVPLS